MSREKTKDLAYALMKGAVGMIPLAGAPASELLSILVAPPLEQRRQQWMTDVGERLRKLEDEGKLDLEKLRGNGLFIDVVMQATHHALKTCEEEKIAYFKNVIEKLAVGDAPDRTITQGYLNLLDRYTVWHIKILSLFDGPEGWLESHGIEKPSLMMGGLSTILLAAFPELKSQRSLYDLIWAELERDGMHRSGSLQSTVSASGMLATRTSEFGNGFLRFITADS